MCKDEVRKAREQLELNLTGDVKNNMGLYRYTQEKKKVKENILG